MPNNNEAYPAIAQQIPRDLLAQESPEQPIYVTGSAYAREYHGVMTTSPQGVNPVGYYNDISTRDGTVAVSPPEPVRFYANGVTEAGIDFNYIPPANSDEALYAELEATGKALEELSAKVEEQGKLIQFLVDTLDIKGLLK